MPLAMDGMFQGGSGSFRSRNGKPVPRWPDLRLTCG
jgi:hypothetical protein